MDNRETKPAVEEAYEYEDPTPGEQKRWNFGITGMLVLLVAVFALVIVLAVVVF